jgi:hypothetical protein
LYSKETQIIRITRLLEEFKLEVSLVNTHISIVASSEPMVKFERVNLPDFITHGGLFLFRMAKFSVSQLFSSSRVSIDSRFLRIVLWMRILFLCMSTLIL